MNVIGREIGHFFVGIMFLTRLPVPAGIQHVEGRLARSARYFPLVGVLIGLFTGLIFLGASLILPAAAAAGLTIAAGLFITGALHEDGLADSADGLGGGKSREHAMEIMRDSRIGSYGAVALITSIGLRWSALAAMTGMEGLIALVICHAVSRAIVPLVLVSGSYARTRGLASSVSEGVTVPEAAFALAVAIGISMIAGPAAGFAACAAAMIAGGAMLLMLIRRIGGYTGDGLGAVQQFGEIAVLLVLAGYWH